MNNTFLRSALYVLYISAFVLGGYFLFAPSVSYDVVFESAKSDYYNETVDVTIKGEVKNEGIYSVNKGMTYYDAVYMAGGVTKDAYVLAVDTDTIITEPCEIEVLSLENSGIVTKTEYDIGSDANSHKLNINNATEKQLTILKGVGETLSKRIVEYREKNGNFKSVNDILNVRGIGMGTYSKIKDYITVGEG